MIAPFPCPPYELVGHHGQYFLQISRPMMSPPQWSVRWTYTHLQGHWLLGVRYPHVNNTTQLAGWWEAFDGMDFIGSPYVARVGTPYPMDAR